MSGLRSGDGSNTVNMGMNGSLNSLLTATSKYDDQSENQGVKKTMLS